MLSAYGHADKQEESRPPAHGEVEASRLQNWKLEPFKHGKTDLGAAESSPLPQAQSASRDAALGKTHLFHELSFFLWKTGMCTGTWLRTQGGSESVQATPGRPWVLCSHA